MNMHPEDLHVDRWDNYSERASYTKITHTPTGLVEIYKNNNSLLENAKHYFEYLDALDKRVTKFQEFKKLSISEQEDELIKATNMTYDKWYLNKFLSMEMENKI